MKMTIRRDALMFDSVSSALGWRHSVAVRKRVVDHVLDSPELLAAVRAIEGLLGVGQTQVEALRDLLYAQLPPELLAELMERE